MPGEVWRAPTLMHPSMKESEVNLNGRTSRIQVPPTVPSTTNLHAHSTGGTDVFFDNNDAAPSSLISPRVSEKSKSCVVRGSHPAIASEDGVRCAERRGDMEKVAADDETCHDRVQRPALLEAPSGAASRFSEWHVVLDNNTTLPCRPDTYAGAQVPESLIICAVYFRSA